VGEENIHWTQGVHLAARATGRRINALRTTWTHPKTLRKQTPYICAQKPWHLDVLLATRARASCEQWSLSCLWWSFEFLGSSALSTCMAHSYLIPEYWWSLHFVFPEQNKSKASNRRQGRQNSAATHQIIIINHMPATGVSKISQTQKHNCCIIILIWRKENKQIHIVD
jgi:hypothetical protein